MSNMQNKFIAELLTKGMEGGNLQAQYKQLIQQLNNTKNTNEQKIQLLKQATKLVKESTDNTFISLVMLGLLKMVENDIGTIRLFSEMPEFTEFVQKAELLTKESVQSNFLFLQFFGTFSRYLQPSNQLFQFGYTTLTQLIDSVTKGITSSEQGVTNTSPGQRIQQEDVTQQKQIIQLQLIAKFLRNECFMIGYFTNELQDNSVTNFYKGKSYINPDKIKPFIQILQTLIKDYHPTLLYQTFVCVWIMSFWGPFSKQLISQGLIGLLIRALSSKQVQSNSKLVRIIMLLLGNLKNDPQAVTIMLTLNGQRLMQQLLTLSWPSDSEIESSVSQMLKLFQKTIVDTSTIQRYKMELEQTTMEMTPLHTNVPFWKANAGLMVSDGAYILKRLVEIGQAAQDREDNDTIRVVLNDLGMFVQYHPQGRKWVEQLPEMLRFSMKCLSAQSEDVQTVALQTVSKLLLNKVV